MKAVFTNLLILAVVLIALILAGLVMRYGLSDLEGMEPNCPADGRCYPP